MFPFSFRRQRSIFFVLARFLFFRHQSLALSLLRNRSMLSCACLEASDGARDQRKGADEEELTSKKKQNRRRKKKRRGRGREREKIKTVLRLGVADDDGGDVLLLLLRSLSPFRCSPFCFFFFFFRSRRASRSLTFFFILQNHRCRTTKNDVD